METSALTAYVTGTAPEVSETRVALPGPIVAHFVATGDVMLAHPETTPGIHLVWPLFEERARCESVVDNSRAYTDAQRQEAKYVVDNVNPRALRKFTSACDARVYYTDAVTREKTLCDAGDVALFNLAAGVRLPAPKSVRDGGFTVGRYHGAFKGPDGTWHTTINTQVVWDTGGVMRPSPVHA